VAVEGAVVRVPVEQLAKVAQVFAEPLGWRRRVLPSLPGIRLVGQPRGGAEPRLPDLPDTLLLLDVVEQLHGGRALRLLQLAHELLGLAVGLVRGLASVLDEQESLAIGQHGQVLLRLHVLGLDVPDELLVDALEADGAGL
jgi:hypothetical protein